LISAFAYLGVPFWNTFYTFFGWITLFVVLFLNNRMLCAEMEQVTSKS
jgi:TM2 domain-containing membrane protein YozV